MEPIIRTEEIIGEQNGGQNDEIMIIEEKINIRKELDLNQIKELLTEERINSNINKKMEEKSGLQIISENRKSETFRNNRTFVQILQEMFPNRNAVRYVEEGRSGPPHSPRFRIAVHVNGLVFYGNSRTKQSARHEAAQNAIQYFRLNTNQLLSSYNSRTHNRRHNPYNSNQRYQPYINRFENNYYNQLTRNYTDYRHGLALNRTESFTDYPPEDEIRYDSDYSNYYRFEPQSDIQYFDESLIRDTERQLSNRREGQTFPSIRNVYRYPSPPRHSIESFHSQSPNTTTITESLSFSSPVIKNVDDFTADDRYDDNFVEFKENSDDKLEENIEDKSDEEQDLINKSVNNKKERIILRVMSETPVHQNPVSVIHELHPDSKWECIETNENNNKKHSFVFKMKLRLPVANQSFIGLGRTKKLAKSEAASKALLQLYNISLNPQNADNPESYVPKSTVHMAQEPLFLKQDIANRIGSAVMLKCNEVWDKLIDIKKWTVLSSIVLTDESDINFIDVICMTSGTKCVKGDSLSMNGFALNDCHAEVLSRRCFLNYIYNQIDKIIENNYEDKPEFILERRPDTYGFRIKKNIKVNLFISTAPCGDSRVFSPKEENESDAHPNRVTRGVLRAKIEGGEGTIPVKRDAILTWDGILQGHQRLQFMSCSDKMSLWNVVGIQGALLSHIIEPIYLESIVLGSLFNYEHLVRAVHGRLNLNFDSNSLKSLPETFHLNKSKVAKCQLKEDITRQLTKAPPYAINWIKFDDKPEVISCDSGRIHLEGGVSRLAKRSLFARFRSLLGRNAPLLPTCSLGQNIPIIYRDGKTSSLEYQRAKTQCMQTFQEQNLGNWIQVPPEIDLFRL